MIDLTKFIVGFIIHMKVRNIKLLLSKILNNFPYDCISSTETCQEYMASTPKKSLNFD